MKIFFKVILLILIIPGNLNAQHVVVETVAGIPGVAGYSGEFVNGLDSEINGPISIASDSEGNIYWTQLLQHRILKYDINTKLVSTYVGTGENNTDPDGDLAASTDIQYPAAICFDQYDNLYFTQAAFVCAIRVVHKDDGKVYTIVGDGGVDYSADGYKGTETGTGAPYGVAADDAGNIYWVEASGDCIRKWNSNDSIVELIAGLPVDHGEEVYGVPANTSQISIKGGIDVTGDGNSIFYTTLLTEKVNEVYNDSGIWRIRSIAGTGTAGFNGLLGLANTIQLHGARGVKIGPDGLLYIADVENGLIRTVDLATGYLSTIAGVAEETAYNFNYLNPLFTQMEPADITFGVDEDIFFTDNGNHLIRRIFTCQNPVPNSVSIAPDSYCAGDSLTLTIDGDLNDGDDWYWRFNDCSVVLNPAIDSGEVISIVAPADNISYFVHGNGGCTYDEDCLEQIVGSTCVEYSNAFSPNADGINDYFDIEISEAYDKNELFVYTRYGDEIFYMLDYDNEINVWDGTDEITGDVVMPGTYYFILYDTETGNDVVSGWVQVIR